MFRLPVFTILLCSLFGSVAHSETPLCETYEELYTNANKELASIYAGGIADNSAPRASNWLNPLGKRAGGIADNSAPRASNRQLEMLNERIYQLILIEQMQAHGCDIPKKPSSDLEFWSSALECEEASKEEREALCNRANWQSGYEGRKTVYD
ncbi:MAG: hypothetical protein GDA41_00110 [Rhodospirillales bacterium]|nr:hypothetical protein [Rhodospirillales bacterium]